MKFLLDTDHISQIQKKQLPEYPAIMAHVALHAPADIVTCVVSFHEQVLGCQTYLARAKGTADFIRGYHTLSDVIRTFSRAVVLPFDANAGLTLDQLVTKKLGVKAMDLRIAAIARANGLTLVTRNTSDFARVPGLPIEDWTK